MHELAINPIIYAELSLNYESIETLDVRVTNLELVLLELPRGVVMGFAAHVRRNATTGSSAAARRAGR